MDGTTTVEDKRSAPTRNLVEEWRAWLLNRRGPGWLFYLVMAAATLPLIWADSSPTGGHLFWTILSLWVLFIGALLWLIRLINWFAIRNKNPARASGRRFLIAPLCGCIVGGLLFVDAPLQARWSQAQSTMEGIVEAAPPAPNDGTPLEFAVPDVASTYRLDGAVRVGDDIFISVSGSGGGFFPVDAGFAYLPDGANPQPSYLVDGADTMTYEHLTGDWYQWFATW